MNLPRSLVEAVRTYRAVPFIGAGVSVGIKPGLFPTWKRLLEDLASELDAEQRTDAAQRVRHLVHAEDFIAAAETGLQGLGAYRFHCFLRERFRKRRPADADLRVVRAIWALRPPLVITTNYDGVLRWAGPDEVQYVANDQVEELAMMHEATSDWPWLWYLHGTIDRLATVILAGSDYRRLYSDDKHARSELYERALVALHHQLHTRPFLYIGFSLGDAYVLQQISHVLKISRDNVTPSFALMKRGQANAADLWENYRVQLIEYEDHGGPLAELLEALAAQAFGQAAVTPRSAGPVSFDLMPIGSAMGSAMPDAGPGSPAAPEAASGAAAAGPSRPTKVEIGRDALEREYTGELLRSRRLLLLAPRRGGARTVARRIAKSHFAGRATWLSPPNVPSCTAEEYYAALLRDDSGITNAFDLKARLHEKARGHRGEHLVVLRHDGGPMEHLKSLGFALRSLIEEAPGQGLSFVVLTVGEAACAALRFLDLPNSLFSGAPVRHVPPLGVAEIQAMLDQTGRAGARWAADVHRATGGHPGFVSEALGGGDALDFEAITERLSRSSSVHGRLRMRLAADDHKQLTGERHVRHTLEALLAGRAVRRLQDVEDDLEYPEVRLYYEGLVIAAADGATVFCCEAVRRAAQRMIELEKGNA